MLMVGRMSLQQMTLAWPTHVLRCRRRRVCAEPLSGYEAEHMCFISKPAEIEDGNPRWKTRLDWVRMDGGALV